MKRVFTIISLALLATVACDKQDGEIGTDEKGSVSISCGVATSVVATRAELTTEVNCSTPTVDEFSLTVTGEGVNQEYASVAEFQDEYLHRGIYTATVEAGDVSVEGYDCAAFVAEQTFEVEPRVHTDVQMTATIANALVKVEVSDAFKSYFAGGYELTLTTELGNVFDVTAQSDLLFVAPTSFEIAATATKQPNESGAEATVVTLPAMKGENLAPRTIYTVKYDVSAAGEAKLQITLNDTLVEERVIDNELNQYA